MTLLRDLLTGYGNANFDLARTAGAFVILVYSGLTIASFITGWAFDHAAVAGGFTILLAGVAAFIWTKDNARTAAISQSKQDQVAG